MAGMLIRVLTVILALSLAGCGDDRPEQIAKYQQLSQQRLDTLSTMLNDGQVRNANLLQQYTRILSQQKPDLVPLLNQLATDATARGPMFTSLTRRLTEAQNAANFVDLDQQLAEVENLYQAMDPSLYNDMLSDQLNVVADMSDGALARVNSISREAATLANGSEDFGAGSQLVGNPSYGNWQSGSSGMSIWAWYGMYSMFSNLTRGPIGYDRWSSRRNYSYYNDVGRYRYTSPKQARSQTQTFERTKKQFSSQGKKFDSPYAKSRTGSTSLSRQSTSTPKASSTGRTASSKSKFRSNYSKDSSFRNSSSRTTRGVRRGK
ncbi:hypothetical protein CXF83_19625 [Shewanella sp. Choline-02u-19]|jgi:hypothetical protein|uniref:hypothetical protein n=1 Tax=Shewanella TaxID=22 RepID=UPI000C326724|nr:MULTISPECIES: hypothetical protein [Shewanella]MCL1058768.1 hypothetical protein [Shewanella gelidimarina]PKG55599.1 hypothetical protein CXF82_18890 [Shewanella sp. GutDb-MelDb]PKG76543.1 hypothetical protein CXF86_00175 [Shewanella sp. GutCb]PKH55409.1 hypothetical protein CXF84_17880 [Shewanella sp. Bg11-22]PKI28756.1 hypothetical protein CXF83_19625 [Shewanella sp. Choline-02u-19]